MGCWNKTCGITNLPIMGDQPMITFVLIQNPLKEESHTCYSHSYWNYVPVPIYGKYNDYGWIEEDAGQEYKFKILSEAFGKHCIRIEPRVDNSGYVRYSKVHDNPFESCEILGDSIHGSLFALKDNVFQERKACLISAISVHADTFHELTESFEYGWNNEVVTKAELIELFKDYHKFLNDRHLEDTLLDEGDSREQVIRLLDKLRRQLDAMGPTNSVSDFFESKGMKVVHPYDHPLNRMVLFWSDRHAGSQIGYLTSRFVSVANELDTKLVTADLVDAWAFGELFDQLRKTIAPTGHEGSQEQITYMHKRFLTSFAKRIKADESMYAEGDG